MERESRTIAEIKDKWYEVESRLSYEAFAMSALLQQMVSDPKSLQNLENFNVPEGFQCTIFPLLRELGNLFYEVLEIAREGKASS